MQKEHEPGMFGKRMDVESPRAGDKPKEYGRIISGQAKETFFENTREMNNREKNLVKQAEEIVSQFIFERFTDRIEKIHDSPVRISSGQWQNNKFVMNEFIEIAPLRNNTKLAELVFLVRVVHEILHFYSPRRRFVGTECLVDQTGTAVTALSSSDTKKFFEGLNEALVSSLQHRLVYQFALSEDFGLSEEVKLKVLGTREQGLAKNDGDPIHQLVNEEAYPSFETSNKPPMSSSYLDERVFLRLIMKKVAESSERSFEDVQAQFDRVVFYGWDDKTKQDIIKAVGSDVWRALAWMQPGVFFFNFTNPDGYIGLFRRIVSGDLEEAQKIARAIVKEKQRPIPPA